jgi:isoleucyl-tRNA synthetase
MCSWPSVRKDLVDKSLEKGMTIVREISEAASNARQKGGRKLRWPVARVIIAPSQEAIELGALEEVLKEQVNSKGIVILSAGERPKMTLEMHPVHKKIGPAFKGDAKNVVEALKMADPILVKSLLDAGEAVLCWEGKSFAVTREMVEFEEIPPENLFAAEFSRGSVYVDVSLSPELEAEGYAREIIRRIQEMRKELDLKVEDQIRAVVNIDSKPILDLALRQKEYIAQETRSAEFELGLGLDVGGDLVKDWEIEGLRVKIGLQKNKVVGAL